MTMTVPMTADAATSVPTLYLSRLLLNPRHRAVRADLGDCNSLHRTIMRAFPSVPSNGGLAEKTGARERFDVLYRVDDDPRARGPILLVQSRVVPAWWRLPADYLVPARGGQAIADCKRVDERYAAIAEGMALSFRLRANPTRKIDTKSGPNGERRNGKRVELRHEDDQLAWLRRKGEQHGFDLLATTVNPTVADVRASGVGKVTGSREKRAAVGEESGGGTLGGSSLTFGSVLFEGRLRVVDPSLIRDALTHGIGSGKAYGFGLLSIAPPRR